MVRIRNFVRSAALPVRGQRGVTLLELLAVLTVIAILAAIAAPRYAAARDRAYLVTLQADLHELRIAQEAYRSSDGHLQYASDLEHLGDRFVAGDGVTVEIVEAGPNKWTAEARHERTSRTCAISSDWGSPDCSGNGLAGGADGNQRRARSGWQVK
jgi:prepilin-type N-terminal cleavage/methylation domain-containing protein